MTLSLDGCVIFTVEDDGTGFDPATTVMGSRLHAITERLAALGGTLNVASAPGQGTRVTGRMPAPADPGTTRTTPDLARLAGQG